TVSCNLRGEGAAAAAVALGVRIDEDESLPHQRLFVVQSGAIQVQKALGIDEDASTKLLENSVAVARLCIQSHGIRQTRTATTLHAYAQPSQFWRNAFLNEQRENFLRGALGDVHLGSCRIGDFGGHFVFFRWAKARNLIALSTV